MKDNYLTQKSLSKVFLPLPIQSTCSNSDLIVKPFAGNEVNSYNLPEENLL